MNYRAMCRYAQSSCYAAAFVYQGGSAQAADEFEELLISNLIAQPDLGATWPDEGFGMLQDLVVTTLVTAGSSALIARVGSTTAAKGVSSADSIEATIARLGAGKSSRVSVVGSSDEIYGLFGNLSRGGTAVESGYAGKLVRLSDGTMVGWRPVSKSGGPAVDIRLPSGDVLKVHVQPWPE